MHNCFRCKKPIPEPDLKEMISLESDWRQWLDAHPDEALNDDERVMVCMNCFDKLEELDNQ